MDSNKIFTRRTMGLDNRVWRTMIMLVLISATFLSYKILDREKCIPFNFDIGRTNLQDSFYYAGDKITFIASISSKKITWDFGDKSTLGEGAVATHTYPTKGKYYVSASIGPDCETGHFITIKEKPLPISKNESDEIKEIVGNTSAIAGTEEEFISPALADSIYEWVVLYHPEIEKRYGKTVKFKFPKAEKYIIELTLDHNRLKNYRKEIFVEPDPRSKARSADDVGILIPKNLTIPKQEDPAPVSVPVPTQPEPIVEAPVGPKSKFVLDETFKNYLQSVVESSMIETDLYKYLCGAGSTPVIANGERKKIKNFSSLCDELSGKKEKNWFLGKQRSITIKYVKLTRDENKCVTKIEVHY